MDVEKSRSCITVFLMMLRVLFGMSECLRPSCTIMEALFESACFSVISMMEAEKGESSGL